MIQILLQAAQYFSIIIAEFKLDLHMNSEPTTRLLEQTIAPSYCNIAVTDGSVAYIYYNPANQTINYITTIPNGGYFAIGYGTNMLKADMVVWFASGSNSFQQQLYSETMDMPDILTTNSYVTSFTPLTNSLTQFFTSRYLQPT